MKLIRSHITNNAQKFPILRNRVI